MGATTLNLGICRNARCYQSPPVERYEGPGMYCPGCGELLQAYTPAESSRHTAAEKTATPAPAPARVDLPQPATVSVAAPSAPVLHQTKPRSSLPLRLSIVIAGVAAIGVAVWLVMSGNVNSGTPVVGVCSSSMTGRLANDVLSAYAQQNQAFAHHFVLRAQDCALRFFSTTGAPASANVPLDMRGLPGEDDSLGGGVIARDGIVAVVSPQNRLSHLSVAQLRAILSGRIRNWKVLGGKNLPIAVIMPNDATDEARLAVLKLLPGTALSSSAYRVPSSSDVVRAVAAANGRNTIGLVAFSQAVPAKVVRIDHFPTPSTISIADNRYPYAIGLAVRGAQIKDPAVANLLAFATSSGAKDVAVRDGFLP